MTTPKNRRIFLLLTIVATALALVAGCGRNHQTVVTITGASTLLTVVERAARALEEKHPQYRFEVSAGGTQKGIDDTRNGFSALGMCAREPTPEEKAEFQIFDVATDGVAVVVHQSNAISAISKEQLRAIYTRQVTDWKSLGGGKGAIFKIKKGPGFGLGPVFARWLGLAEAEMQADAVAGNNSQVLLSIAAQPVALGYVSLGEALASLEKGAPIKMLALDGGIAPTVENVMTGKYPVQLRLALISRGEPSEGARLLLDYVRSAEGRTIIEESNYVAR